ncbi:GAP family protein [Paenibacillus lautus]|uniref:GAP family protein n=1 Tax=Paenibacillus lautus TaxID=1401 RepID=UPI0039870706
MWINILGLALLDSLSFASIVVTIFLLLSTAYRPDRIMAYLLTVAGFYILLGIALMNGAGVILQFWLSGWKEHAVMSYMQLLLGIILVLIGVRLDNKPKGRSYKLERIRPQDTYPSMMKLGISVSMIEAVTMLPFLSAIGLMTTRRLEVYEWMPMLAAYCAVMIAPPCLLLTLRYLIGDKANGLLSKINRKIEPYTQEALAVIAIIAGIYLISDASDVVFFNGQ